MAIISPFLSIFILYTLMLYFLILLLHILNCSVLLIKMCLCEIILFSNASVQFSHSVMSNSLWPPWTTAHQASLSNSQRLLKLTSIELVMPSNHLIFCHPPFLLPLQSYPASESFPMSQFFTSDSQSIGVSASASVLSMNTQDWSPLGWTGWISLQSKGLSRVFSNTTVQKHQFFSIQLSL